MKILKSKLLVALMIGGLMSSMLSFSTVSIAGQDASSTAADLQSESQSSSLWKAFLEGLKGHLNGGPVFFTGANGDNNNRANEYPTDALD